MTDTAWPFGDDANRHDPLTAHRIAVTSSHPGWAYLVAFDRDSEERPTDAEAQMLTSYLDEYKDHWYGDNGFRRQMEDRGLDIDGGANGVIFHKWAADDWGYRRRSYTIGYLFTVTPPGLRGIDGHTGRGKLDGPMTLAELMDHIHTIGDGEPLARWTEWKAAHADVFGAQAAAR